MSMATYKTLLKAYWNNFRINLNNIRKSHLDDMEIYLYALENYIQPLVRTNFVFVIRTLVEKSQTFYIWIYLFLAQYTNS